MGKLKAKLITSMGHITIELFPDSAPETVANFVGLAEGTKEWLDPRTLEWVKRPFYNGLNVHRAIPHFMVQLGCPLGNGTGGPGYTFKDEIDPKLKFDRSGRVAMANAGPDTNGSQFFITHVATPHLDGLHTIFGQVTEGQNVVEAIARLARDESDCPLVPVTINRVTIHRDE